MSIVMMMRGMHWRDRVISVISEDGSVGSTRDVVITEVSDYVLARLERRLRRVIWVEGEGDGVYIPVFRNVDCVRPVELVKGVWHGARLAKANRICLEAYGITLETGNNYYVRVSRVRGARAHVYLTNDRV